MTSKIVSGTVSGRTFSSPGSFSVDFGVPAGRQNWQKTAPEQHDAYFWTTFFRFFRVLFARACSGRVPDRFRRLRRPSRIRDFQKFYDTFLLVFAILFCRLRADFVRVCRVPPGCCRDPHPDAVIHSPFSPGVRRCAQRFKFALPQRDAGMVLNGCVKSPVWEGLPLLTSPPAVRRPPYPPTEPDLTPFFRFFVALKKTLKKPIVKNLFISRFFVILARPGVDF